MMTVKLDNFINKEGDSMNDDVLDFAGDVISDV